MSVATREPWRFDKPSSPPPATLHSPVDRRLSTFWLVVGVLSGAWALWGFPGWLT